MTKQINEIGRECSRCNEFKNWSEYYKKKSQKTGFASACKNCLGNKDFKSDTIEEYLDKRIDKSVDTGCWDWTGHKDKAEYGVICNPWRKQFGTQFAHRVSYIVSKGQIEEGMLICHHCDNPSCVNPDHIYEGTAQDNVNDRTIRNRHKGPNRKLTPEQVREIRKLSKISAQRDIAKIYKISQATVGRIINKKHYKDIQ